MAAAIAIVANEMRIDTRILAITDPNSIAHAGHLAALAAWRVTQGIYRFDKELYAALRETPVLGDIPHNVLYRLPEWCVYVETHGIESGRQLHGVFVHLEHDVNTGRPELRLVLDTETELVNLILHLGPWPLREALSRMLQTGAENATSFGFDDEFAALKSSVPGGMANALQLIVEPLVSMLLYLCSQNAEIGDGSRRPTNPVPSKVKTGKRLFAPGHATTWDVGVRLGAALRRADDAAGANGLTEDTHARPRPHIRRAHWHGFWNGPMESKSRTYSVKWLPPIPVNVVDVGDLPATVRAVT